MKPVRPRTARSWSRGNDLDAVDEYPPRERQRRPTAELLDSVVSELETRHEYRERKRDGKLKLWAGLAVVVMTASQWWFSCINWPFETKKEAEDKASKHQAWSEKEHKEIRDQLPDKIAEKVVQKLRKR